jgi:ABC-type Fe3+-siderophore transport system permease subunit
VKKNSQPKLTFILGVGVILIALLSVLLGSVNIPLQDFFAVLKERVTSGFTLSQPQERFSNIIFQLRIPRTLL